MSKHEKGNRQFVNFRSRSRSGLILKPNYTRCFILYDVAQFAGFINQQFVFFFER